MRKNHTLLYRLLLLILPLLASCKHDQLEVYEENISYRPAADFIRNNYDLSLFAAAIEKAGMTEELNGKGPFTVLAPNNAAFYEMGIQHAEDFDRLQPDSLKRMVRYHILDRKLLIADIPHRGVDVRYGTLAENRQIYVSHEDLYGTGGYYFNGSEAIVKDVVITNGALHVLNKVMKYEPGTVQDWLSKREAYSILTAAFKKFGLWNMLAEEGPYTVFAPDNAAFEAAGITLGTIAQMDTANYVGDRLFGAYIQRQRNLFISDFQVFRSNNDEYSLDMQVYGDSHYMAISAERDQYSRTFTYGLQLRTARDWPFTALSLAAGKVRAYSDNLTDNGLIQPLTGVAVLPSEARK